MEHIDYQGKKIAFRQTGEGGAFPLVLLHGFCEDSRMWDAWVELLPARQRVIRIDLPGFGQSELLENQSVDYMADAVEAVLNHLQTEKCVLTGHSMGGYVSLAFAEKNADRLAGLCLFHAHPFADPEEKKEGRLKSAAFIRNSGSEAFVRQLIPGLFAKESLHRHTTTIEKLTRYALEYQPSTIITALLAMRDRPDRSAVLQKIACPVLFFIGKLDTAVPPEFSLDQTHLPAISHIYIYPEVGHMGMFEAKEESARAMRAFLNEIK